MGHEIRSAWDTSRRRGPLAGRALCAAAVAATAAGAPAAAGAQVLQRFALRAELGAGTMLTDYQRNADRQRFGGNALGYDGPDYMGTVRLGFTVYGPLVVQASFANWLFPSSTLATPGRVMAFEGGVRVEPRVGRLGRFFVDGNAGYARTGPFERAEINAGVGFEFALGRAVGLGPVVRVADVLQQDAPVPGGTTYPFDAVFWTAGLSLACRVPPPAPPVPDLLDADCDRVPDVDDLCASVNPGARPDPAHRGCPLLDADNDGVLDRDDRCVTTPAGDYPDEAPGRRGCPDPDLDHDGERNVTDLCPAEPAGPTPDPARQGCPDPSPVAAVERDRIRLAQPVVFDANRWAVDATDAEQARRNREALDAVASLLRHHAAIRRVEVQSHTDDRCTGCRGGPRAHNLALTERRAAAVRDYLVSRGVDGGRLVARGYGQGTPLGPNDTEAHRQANRRVEFRIVEAAWSAPPQPPPAARPRPLPPLAPLPALPSRPCRLRPVARAGGAP